MRSLGVYFVDKTSITIKSEVTANISPATLVPYFDPDTRLVFLSGKVGPTLLSSSPFPVSVKNYTSVQGDTSVLAYEYVPTESPYLFEVTPFACGSPHQVRINPIHVIVRTFIVVHFLLGYWCASQSPL